VLMLRTDPEAMAAVLFIGLFVGTLNHANVNWRWPKPFSYLFTSPFIHRWHHGKGQSVRCNYANTLVLLDVLFGTYYAPDEPCSVVGFEGDETYPKSFLGRLMHPMDQWVKDGWKNLRQ